MTAAHAGNPGLLFISLGLAAAAFWGASDFLGGLATRRAHVVLVVAIAHSLSLALLLPLAWLTHGPVPGYRFLLLGLCAGVFGGIAIILYYQALSMGEMGLITALTGLLTALIPVAVSWVRQGTPKTTQLAGFALAAAAIVLIAYAPAGKVRPLALGLATLAGICFGVFLVVLQVGSKTNIVWQLISSRVASSILATSLACWMRWRHRSRPAGASPPRRTPASPDAPPRQIHVVLMAASAGLLEASGSLLYMRAVQHGRLDVAAVLASLYPAVTILLAMGVLKEKTTSSQALGMALALVAVLFISI